MYNDLLPIRKEQSFSHFGHAGTHFPETIMAWGLWGDRDYNDGVNVDGWMGHHYNGLEKTGNFPSLLTL